MLLNVVGCWVELLVFVFVVVGIMCVVMVVVDLLEELLGMCLVFYGLCIGLKYEFLLDEFIVNWFMLYLLRSIVFLVLSCFMMCVLYGLMKFLSI